MKMKQCMYLKLYISNFRSSLPEVLCEKDVLKNFAKFKGKHLCQGLFFTKVFYNSIKEETLAQVFSSEFYEIFKITPFLKEYLRWLLLKLAISES